MSSEEIALLIVSLIATVAGVPLTQWLKNKLGLDSTSAMTLSIAVSIVVSVVALFGAGEVGYLDFSWENLPATVALVYGLAVVVYNAFRGRK